MNWIAKSASNPEFSVRKLRKTQCYGITTPFSHGMLLDRNDIAFTVLRFGCRDGIESRSRELGEYSTSRNACVPVTCAAARPLRLLLPPDISLSFRELLKHRYTREELQVTVPRLIALGCHSRPKLLKKKS